MLIQKPENIIKETSLNSFHAKYVYGYKGWLLFINGIFLLIGVYRTNVIYSNIDNVYDSFPDRERYIFWLWLIVGCINTVLPLVIAFSLYFKRLHSLMIAKICITLLPVGAFMGMLFINPYKLDYFNAFKIGLLPALFFLSIPAFLYLNYSKRVKTTFLFHNDILPKIFNCPYCLCIIKPNDEEQKYKEVVCSNYNKLISQNNITG